MASASTAVMAVLLLDPVVARTADVGARDVGCGVGARVVCDDGASVGCNDGASVGFAVRTTALGEIVDGGTGPAAVGALVVGVRVIGASDVGGLVGVCVGVCVGAFVGESVGASPIPICATKRSGKSTITAATAIKAVRGAMLTPITVNCAAWPDLRCSQPRANGDVRRPWHGVGSVGL